MRTGGALIACALLAPSTALASAYRLRADALTEVRSPVGLVAVSAGADPLSWLGAEAMVWAGAGDEAEADALVAAIRLRDPEGRAELGVGRLLLTVGGLPPVHADAAIARGRLPIGTMFEAYAGMPVVPRFGERSYDWLAGGRVSQAIPGIGSAGVAYLQRRDAGQLATHAIAADLAFAPLAAFDLAARGSWDMITEAVIEGTLNAGIRLGPAVLIQVDGSHRSPSLLLPATSLFSVIGDGYSDYAGGGVRWQIAPRLQVVAEGGARGSGGRFGEAVAVRATLRIGAQGRGHVGLDLRREGVPDAEWTGARASFSFPILDSLDGSFEAEIAVPDADRGRGTIWPWGLAALAWRPIEGLEVAAAMEAYASPERSNAIDGLIRLSYDVSVAGGAR